MLYRLSLLLFLVSCTTVAWAQYQDYSRMGKTPAELTFIDDPMEIELKEPSWWWHNPKKNTPADQLLYAASLERDGDFSGAIDAYDDLVHEWHATPEALKAQLALARLNARLQNTKAAYEADIYLLAHFAGRFELEPVLLDAVAQADLLAQQEQSRSLRLQTNKSLRENYERIIHFAPRWPRVPELLLKIADLYNDSAEYSSTITVCDRILADWPTDPLVDRVVSVYCAACRAQADVWKNDTGRLLHLEKLLAGAQVYRPNHPEREQFKAWEREVYELRRARSYAKAVFYDNPAAYSLEAAARAYEGFLKDFPDAPEVPEAKARLEALKAQLQEQPEETR